MADDSFKDKREGNKQPSRSNKLDTPRPSKAKPALYFDGIPEAEWRRLKELTAYEERAHLSGYRIIAGIDEAGRGPLAGPVVAAACIIPRDLLIPGIDDSKKLTPEKRNSLFETIVSNKKITYASGLVEHDVIDRVNIFQATIQAMLIAVAGLKEKPDFLLVDGLKLPHSDIICEKIIRGDSLSQSIAAASIIAKVTRDRLMCELHKKYPQYGFDTHKGYPTRKHLEALRKHGPSPIHRMTFHGVLPEAEEALI